MCFAKGVIMQLYLRQTNDWFLKLERNTNQPCKSLPDIKLKKRFIFKPCLLYLLLVSHSNTPILKMVLVLNLKDVWNVI